MNYQDYGYRSAIGNSSDSYLLGPLRQILGEPTGPVLDIGCGNGAIARALLAEGVDIFGVDASESGIAIANELAPGRFFLSDISEERLPDQLAPIAFTKVISTEVISHLYSPRSLLRLARRSLALSGGGELILSAPYHGYLKNVALAVSGKLDSHFTALWDGGFVKFFSRESLTRLLVEEGFVVTDFVGAGRFPLLWKSMLIKAEVGGS